MAAAPLRVPEEGAYKVANDDHSDEPAADQIRTADSQAQSLFVAAPVNEETNDRTEVDRPRKRRQNLPERRGGGQVDISGDIGTDENPILQSDESRPRVVCFKGGDRMWWFAVELPEEIDALNTIRVTQDGIPLKQIASEDGRWLLNRLAGEIEADEQITGGRHWRLRLAEDQFLSFKLLTGCTAEEGRLVTVPSSGEYLVVAREEWSADDPSSIGYSTEPNISIDHCRGYRIRVGDSGRFRLELHRSDGQRRTISARVNRFRLKGNRAPALYAEYDAPVFLNLPPTITAPDAESWTPIRKIVIGVAGRGSGKWKIGIHPAPVNSEVTLEAHMVNLVGGWYYARFYDEGGLLVDSLYFAFTRMLYTVRLSNASILPGVLGHIPARLEFEHHPDAKVEVISPCGAVLSTGRGAFEVPIRCERVDWHLILSGEPPFQCSTCIGRVFWALGREAGDFPGTDWTDKPVRAARGHFMAVSKEVLFIQLPIDRSVRSFMAGFSRETARSFSAHEDRRVVAIRLRDFAASGEVSHVGTSSLSLWIRDGVGEIGAEALRIETAYECCFCQRHFGNEDDCLEHATEHENEFFAGISYDELRARNPSLPRAIYQCATCDRYIRADVAGNPVDAIIAHIDRTHSHRNIPARMSWRVVNDLNEIRQIVDENLPRIVRCNRCGEEFENGTSAELARHIMRCHRADLFSLA